MGIENLGISKNQYPKMMGKYSGSLVICASGRCVWDDLEALGLHIRQGSWSVMAVNDVVMHIPLRVDHAYSNDHISLDYWVQARRPRYKRDYHENIIKHTCKSGMSTQIIWPLPGYGTSSLNAVFCGLCLGYDRIVLCGCPLDDSGHYFDPPWVSTRFAKEGHRDNWKTSKQRIFDGKVRSMSGFTRDLLGSHAG